MDAQENRATLDLSYPVENYTVTNRKDMEEVWQYCFMDILGCDCGEYNPVLLTDGPVDAELKTKARAKMAEVKVILISRRRSEYTDRNVEFLTNGSSQNQQLFVTQHE